MEATGGPDPYARTSDVSAIQEVLDNIERGAPQAARIAAETKAAADHAASVSGEQRIAGYGRAMPPWPRVSVVIPTLNEEQNLPHVFARLPKRLHEVIVVDGLSTDATVEVARFLRPSVKVVLQDTPGKGAALRSGFDAATGDVIVMLDADGSADPGEIPRFVEALVAGADFAKGSRFRDGGGSDDLTRLRRVGNYGLNAVVNVLFGTAYSDLCYGYNAFWRHCLPVMNVDCSGFEVETLINIRIARAGLATCEVPSFESERIHGQSNLRTFRDGWRVLRTILRERVRRVPKIAEPSHAAAPELEAAPVEAG